MKQNKSSKMERADARDSWLFALLCLLLVVMAILTPVLLRVPSDLPMYPQPPAESIPVPRSADELSAAANNYVAVHFQDFSQAEKDTAASFAILGSQAVLNAAEARAADYSAAELAELKEADLIKYQILLGQIDSTDLAAACAQMYLWGGEIMEKMIVEAGAEDSFGDKVFV